MKLEFSIQQAFQGVHTLYNSNPSASWMKAMIDLRPALRKLNLKDNIPFYALRLIEDGALVISGLSMPSERGDEYMASWIYVPSSLFFKLKDSEVFNKVLRLLDTFVSSNNQEVSIYEDIKKTEFKQDYGDGPTITITPSATVGSTNAAFAVHLYRSDDHLRMLLRPKNLCQPNYSDYIGVFFANRKELKQECLLKDISNSDIKQMTLVSVDKKIPYYILIRIDGQQEPINNKTLIYHDSEKLKLTFSRPGFLDIKKVFIVKHDLPITAPNVNDWEMEVVKTFFIVTDENGNPILNYNFEIAGSKKNIICEAAAKDARVTFNADGYNKTTIAVNLLAHPKSHVILKPRTVTRKYIIPLKRGQSHEIEIQERAVDKACSPIKGYQIASSYQCDESYELEQKKTRKKPIFWGLVSGFILGILLGLLLHNLSPNKTKTMEQGNVITEIVGENNDSNLVVFE